MISVELRQLLDHMAWADALVWAEVLRVPKAEDDQRLTELLHHVHMVQHVYLQIFRGERVEMRALDEFDSHGAIADWGRSCHAGLKEYASRLDADALDREIAIPWADQRVVHYGRARPTTVRQGLLQLASHSAYHRGQINTRIRTLGGEPPLTDFVVWVWLGRPEAEWPGR